MIEEIWKPVRGFENYAEISNYGQIHRFERVIYFGRNHQIKRIQEETWTYGRESGDYLYASIGNADKGVHVWVYLTFVGDIPEGLEVNHIDENKHNNRLDNLNLMTPKENSNWGTRNKRVAAKLQGRKQTSEHIEKRVAKLREKPNPKVAAALRGRKRPDVAAALSKAVQALDKNGNVVMEFASAQEAKRHGFNAGHISDCCLGNRKSHKGYIWRLKNKKIK